RGGARLLAMSVCGERGGSRYVHVERDREVVAWPWRNREPARGHICGDVVELRWDRARHADKRDAAGGSGWSAGADWDREVPDELGDGGLDQPMGRRQD